MAAMKITLEPFLHETTDEITQSRHRFNLMEYTIEALKQSLKEETDPFTLAVAPLYLEWSANVQLQHAYGREYHEWERACKGFLTTQYAKYGKKPPKWQQRDKSLVAIVREALEFDYGIAIENETWDSIDEMRNWVNKSKHDANFYLEPSIDKNVVDKAFQHISQFWESIENQSGSRS